MTAGSPVAIGDIHGRLDLLDAALAAYPGRFLLLLGDYVDRGPDSPGVIARVRELIQYGRAVALLGNHDQMMIDVLLHGQDDEMWMRNGGSTTVEQYEGNYARMTVDAQWMHDSLLPHYTHRHVLYAHAMRPHPAAPDLHLWGRPTTDPLVPLPDGVTHSVHGHTPMDACPLPIALEDGSVAWYIDTGAVWTGRLCALDTATMTPQIITADPVPA